METYRTEEEQITAIKKFVADHGSKILAVIVLFIALVIGVQGCQQKQQNTKEAASQLFSMMTEQVELSGANPAGLSDDQRLAIDKAYQSLVADHTASIYATYGSFLQAKLAVSAQDYSGAEQNLNWVVDNSTNQEMKNLAKLRLAQVVFASGELDKALALAEKSLSPFEDQFLSLQGDILMAKGDQKAALEAYEKAELASAGSVAPDQMLAMKVKSLKPADADKIVPAASAQ